MVDRKFQPLSQFFHWAVAGLILFQVPLAWYMIELPVSPDKLSTYALHKSIGITIFSVSALRLAWRWMNRPPPLPADMGGLEKFLARLTHFIL